MSWLHGDCLLNETTRGANPIIQVQYESSRFLYHKIYGGFLIGPIAMILRPYCISKYSYVTLHRVVEIEFLRGILQFSKTTWVGEINPPLTCNCCFSDRRFVINCSTNGNILTNALHSVFMIQWFFMIVVQGYNIPCFNVSASELVPHLHCIVANHPGDSHLEAGWDGRRMQEREREFPAVERLGDFVVKIPLSWQTCRLHRELLITRKWCSSCSSFHMLSCLALSRRFSSCVILSCHVSSI